MLRIRPELIIGALLLTTLSSPISAGPATHPGHEPTAPSTSDMAPKQDEPAVDELSAAHYLIGRFFPLLDCENDQLVDAGEIDMHLAAMFGPLDRDRSLSLSKSELVSSPAGTPAYRYQARVFELADRNGDGIISSREFRDHMAHSFALVDANHDGDLRAEEIRPVP